jgi:hypothetical protein
MRWAGHEDVRNANEMSAGKIGVNVRRMDLRKRDYVMDPNGSYRDKWMGSCKHGDERQEISRPVD